MARRDLTANTAEDKFDVEAEARRRGVQPYQLRAANAVGDRLVKDLVADAYKGISQSASMLRPSREPPKPKGNGWVDPAPVKPPAESSTSTAFVTNSLARSALPPFASASRTIGLSRTLTTARASRANITRSAMPA